MSQSLAALAALESLLGSLNSAPIPHSVGAGSAMHQSTGLLAKGALHFRLPQPHLQVLCRTTSHGLNADGHDCVSLGSTSVMLEGILDYREGHTKRWSQHAAVRRLRVLTKKRRLQVDLGVQTSLSTDPCLQKGTMTEASRQTSLRLPDGRAVTWERRKRVLFARIRKCRHQFSVPLSSPSLSLNLSLSLSLSLPPSPCLCLALPLTCAHIQGAPAVDLPAHTGTRSLAAPLRCRICLRPYRGTGGLKIGIFKV